MEKRIMTLLAALFLVIGGAFAQTKVNGTVISQDDGQPVIGASVLVVGTNVGTVTNASGQFSLTVPAGKSMLRITYVGMEPLELSARPNMRILLTSDQNALDEVIVVAYGTAKKSAFTGSAAVMSSEELSKHTVSSITEALAGNVPGLQIRGSSGQPGSGGGAINIRGLSSLYSATDPLVIVDGAPYPASLSNIPASDIESVSVLKDAASAALYGARGASGVIIITTKKGKSHEAKVSADVKWGINSRAIQDYDVLDDPAQFYETYYSALYNSAFYGEGKSAAEANASANTNMLAHLGYNIYNLPEGEMLIGLDGKLNPKATLGRKYTTDSGETYYMMNDDWTDAAYKTALRQEYNVNINAANDRGSFYASVGFLDEDGVIEYSGFRRTTARLKADYQVKPWMKMAANVNYVHSDQTSNPNMSTDWGSTNLMYYTTYIAPIYPIFVRTVDAAGNPIIRTDENGNPQYDYGVAARNYPGAQRGFLQTGNPLGSNHYNETKNVGNQLNGSFTVDIQFAPWLKFNNTSTVILGQTSASFFGNGLYGPKEGVNGELTKYQSNTLRQNHLQTLNFNKKFANRHDVTVMLGHEWWDQKTRYLDATAQGGFYPAVKELNFFANKIDNHSYQSEYNVEGFFANAQYNLDDKYFASASYRRDASSRFDKEHRWGDFWSVGAAWLLNKESWFNVSWVDQLKLKASIGQQGNDNTENFAYTDTYSITPSSETTMSPAFRLIGNPDITWETLTNTNIGLEFSLFKSRLTGNIDWYYRKTTDLLFWLSVPESAGTRGYYGNTGDIRNMGVELNLVGTVIKTRDFQWDLFFNISHNSGKILDLPASKIGENGGYFESPFWYEVDGPLNNYMTYSYAGVNEKGEALYWYDKELSPAGGKKNEDGSAITNKINVAAKEKSGTTTSIGEASRYASGSTLPKAYGGFGTSLRFKGFDASVTFDFQLGGKVYDRGYAKLMTPPTSSSDAGYNYHKDILNSWTPNNTETTVPRFWFGSSEQYAAYGSDRWLTSAKYLNFQSFNVGYTLPKSLTQKIQIENIRVYAAGENLCFWSAREGLDPRYSFGNTASTNVYSPIRTISGGIQFTF